MKTFHVHTLGCKVNQYEGEQIAALLRSHGLVETDVSHADLRVVNTCSVTTEAAGKSRQASRRMVRLPVLAGGAAVNAATDCDAVGQARSISDSKEPSHAPAVPSVGGMGGLGPSRRPRVILTGCWATSDPVAAACLIGVDAVLTHHSDVAAELERLLELWQGEELQRRPRPDPDTHEGVESGDTSRPQRHQRHAPADSPIEPIGPFVEAPPKRLRNDGWITEAGLPAGSRTDGSKAERPEKVNLQIYALSVEREPENPKKFEGIAGTRHLPLLGDRQSGRQRAFLKVQDGCDAHCTYCIIPRLRPTLWTKPVDDAVEEAVRLVASGHVEVVLTGIFLGAYGQQTALRRRQVDGGTGAALADLVTALCTRVRGLRRLRLSSLEPLDLTGPLLDALRSHEQVVPHFHLPLQSGCDALLRRMNRQYTRDDFVRMLDRVNGTFDRPALTTDVIVGFPGEDDAAFGDTVDVVDRAGFIHVHAFPYSPRPGTAAARWVRDVDGKVVNERIRVLGRRADAHSYAFRRRFVGEVVEVLVERDDGREPGYSNERHGRCERYFEVHFDASDLRPGDSARVRVDAITPRRTHGSRVPVGSVRGVVGA
jgi:MiaB/RimO family radical SAM methylthiotransferase